MIRIHWERCKRAVDFLIHIFKQLFALIILNTIPVIQHQKEFIKIIFAKDAFFKKLFLAFCPCLLCIEEI